MAWQNPGFPRSHDIIARMQDLASWGSCNYRVCTLNSRATAFYLAPHALGTAKVSKCEVFDNICYYERASAASGASSFVFKGKIWVFAARPYPARPDPITLFKALYLRNRMSDQQAVFFDEHHLDVKVVWHGCHIASVPVMARGACQTCGTLGDPQNTLPQ